MLKWKMFWRYYNYANRILSVLLLHLYWNRNYDRMPQDVQGQKISIRGEAVIAMVLAVVVCVNMICFGPMATLIGLATGNGTLSDETNEEAAEVAEEIMEDGIVLLKNESSQVSFK